MSKPRVSTVLTLGTGITAGKERHIKFPALVVQIRGVINPNTGQPVASAGMRSLWGEHAKPDETPLQAAVRCANTEFLSDDHMPLGEATFSQVGDEVPTEKSVNTLFFLKTKLYWEDITVREGDGVGFLPIDLIQGYIDHGFLTEASVTTLMLTLDYTGKSTLTEALQALYGTLR